MTLHSVSKIQPDKLHQTIRNRMHDEFVCGFSNTNVQLRSANSKTDMYLIDKSDNL